MDADNPVDSGPTADRDGASALPDSQVPVEPALGAGYDRCPGVTDLAASVVVDGSVFPLADACETPPTPTPYPVLASTGHGGGGDFLEVAYLALACDDEGRVLALGVGHPSALAETAQASVLYIDSEGTRHTTWAGELVGEAVPPERQLEQREPFQDEVYMAQYKARFNDGLSIEGSLRLCWVTFHNATQYLNAATRAFGPDNGLTLFE